MNTTQTRPRVTRAREIPRGEIAPVVQGHVTDLRGLLSEELLNRGIPVSPDDFRVEVRPHTTRQCLVVTVSVPYTPPSTEDRSLLADEYVIGRNEGRRLVQLIDDLELDRDEWVGALRELSTSPWAPGAPWPATVSPEFAACLDRAWARGVEYGRTRTGDGPNPYRKGQ